MKLKLAAQVISVRVAAAIENCNKEINLLKFKDSEGTIAFLRIFDKLFDALNSRNPFGKSSKAPMKVTNRERWMSLFCEAEDYITGLKDEHGVPMYKHNRKKTAFLGFLVIIHSVKNIFQNYVACAEAPLKYLLTYKLSQDHLELFFSAIRVKGFNNNPTAVNFKAAYKQLLMRHHIEETGNCIPVDDTHIMSVGNGSGTCATVSCFREAEAFKLIDNEPAQQDHDYVNVPNVFSALSDCKAAAISNISGYTVKIPKKQIHCSLSRGTGTISI